MSAAVSIIGVGPVPEPVTFKDKCDILLQTLESNPQCLVKSIKYGLSWAQVISSSLPSYSSFAKALEIFTEADDIFTWTDAAANIRAFRNRAIDCLKGNAAASVCIEAVSDVFNSGCEILRWLHTFKIIALTSKVFNRVCFLSGITMMIGFGSRTLICLKEYYYNTTYQKTSLMWNVIKNASLFTFGFFYAVGSFTTLSPLFLLVPGSFSLISTYGTSLANNTAATVTLHPNSTITNNTVIYNTNAFHYNIGGPNGKLANCSFHVI